MQSTFSVDCIQHFKNPKLLFKYLFARVAKPTHNSGQKTFKEMGR